MANSLIVNNQPAASKRLCQEYMARLVGFGNMLLSLKWTKTVFPASYQDDKRSLACLKRALESQFLRSLELPAYDCPGKNTCYRQSLSWSRILRIGIAGLHM